MITISKEVEFDTGHRVTTHGSKCKNPHGHRYKLKVTCVGKIIQDENRPDFGMLVDFGDLKSLMTERIHDVFDHAMVVWEKDHSLLKAMEVDPEWKVVVFPLIPTAENMARWIWGQLQDPIRDLFQDDLELYRVDLWETPTSVASYCSSN